MSKNKSTVFTGIFRDHMRTPRRNLPARLSTDISYTTCIKRCIHWFRRPQKTFSGRTRVPRSARHFIPQIPALRSPGTAPYNIARPHALKTSNSPLLIAPQPPFACPWKAYRRSPLLWRAAAQSRRNNDLSTLGSIGDTVETKLPPA